MLLCMRKVHWLNHINQVSLFSFALFLYLAVHVCICTDVCVWACVRFSLSSVWIHLLLHFSSLYSFQFYFYFLFIFSYSRLSLCQHTIGYDIQIHVITVNYRLNEEKNAWLPDCMCLKTKQWMCTNVHGVYMSLYIARACACVCDNSKDAYLFATVSYVCVSGFYLKWAELRLFRKKRNEIKHEIKNEREDEKTRKTKSWTAATCMCYCHNEIERFLAIWKAYRNII